MFHLLYPASTFLIVIFYKDGVVQSINKCNHRLTVLKLGV